MSRAPFASAGIKLLRPKEVADIFGLSMTTIYSMMRQDTFPSIKIGRQYFVEESALRNWIRDTKRYLI